MRRRYERPPWEASQLHMPTQSTPSASGTATAAPPSVCVEGFGVRSSVCCHLFSTGSVDDTFGHTDVFHFASGATCFTPAKGSCCDTIHHPRCNVWELLDFISESHVGGNVLGPGIPSCRTFYLLSTTRFTKFSGGFIFQHIVKKE